MATYFVGDIQGCYDELRQLLDLARFDPHQDQLWLTGDLVARGPKSLETLRFVKDLGCSAQTVLGNHDLHLLAVAAGVVKPKKRDQLDALLNAADAPELLDWLRCRPLLCEYPALGLIMVHAGISPQWTLQQARHLANEVESQLRGDQYTELLAHMYGNAPDHWNDRLQGMDRWRFIINCFTRMRYCYLDGSMELSFKLGPDANTNPNLKPWYEVPGSHLEQHTTLLFGHWAALMGRSSHPRAIALDTGCVWGHSLTMLRWQDQQYFSLPCPVYAGGGIE